MATIRGTAGRDVLAGGGQAGEHLVIDLSDAMVTITLLDTDLGGLQRTDFIG